MNPWETPLFQKVKIIHKKKEPEKICWNETRENMY